MIAALTSGCPAFQQHVKRAEGSDTTPHLARSESTAHRVKKQQHHQVANRSRSPAGPRRLGTATRIMRIAVPKAFCVLREHTRPRPKSGKVRRSDTRPGDIRERAARIEGNDSAPSETFPVSACKPLCAILLARAECVPAFTRESKRGPFVREVETAMRNGWGTALVAATLPDLI